MRVKTPLALLALSTLMLIVCSRVNGLTAVTNLNSRACVAPSRLAYAQGHMGDNPIRLEEAGIQAQTPPRWKEKHDLQKIELVSPDKSVYIIFWVSAGKDAEETSRELGRSLSILIDDPKFGAPIKGEINGLPILSINGTGSYQGNLVDFNAGLIEAKKSVLLLVIGSRTAIDKYKGDLDSFLKTVMRL